MAVYKRGYQAYRGPLTPAWSRFLIIARHAWAKVFESRFLLALFLVSFLPPLAFAVLIYLPHNTGAISLLNIDVKKLIAIDGTFFLRLMGWQSPLAWIMTCFIGPGLVAPDLRNNALPLYFCHPFSRAEYVLGKISVLAILLSAITWVPGLVLFFLQAGLEGNGWLWKNLWIAWGIFAGSWVWILVLSLLAVAMSAWVKWKVAAAALLFGIFFVSAGFAAAINQAMHTKSGHVINLAYMIRTIWWDLFGVPAKSGPSSGSAWALFAVLCAACLLLLARKIRAYEVVRS